MAEVKQESPILNETMKEAFDWSDDKDTVRTELWDYYMQKDNQNTEKTVDDFEPYMDMDESEIKQKATELLKK